MGFSKMGHFTNMCERSNVLLLLQRHPSRIHKATSVREFRTSNYHIKVNERSGRSELYGSELCLTLVFACVFFCFFFIFCPDKCGSS